MKATLILLLDVLLLIVLTSLLVIQFSSNNLMIDSCINGETFELRSKTYQCLWLDSDSWQEKKGEIK